MSNGISLCIPCYFRNTQIDKTILTLYRVADYFEGTYRLVDSQNFSDKEEDFNPRFVWHNNKYENPRPYFPVLRKWDSMPGEPGKLKSISERYETAVFYEMVVNPDYFSDNDDAAARLLRAGVSLPEGVSDNILVVIAEEGSFYRAVACKKSYFKYDGEKYYIDSNLEDMLHTRHSLPVYLINQENVISTASFSHLLADDDSLLTVRYFYSFEDLPEKDADLFLYRFSEYLPIYISKYMKNVSKDYGQTKSGIRVVIGAVKEALHDREELDKFYADAGFRAKDYEKEIEKCEQRIIDAICNSDYLDDYFVHIIETNNDLRLRFINKVRELWLSQYDEERERLCQQRNEVLDEIHATEDKLTEIDKQFDQMTNSVESLKEQERVINRVINESMEDFEKAVATKLMDNAIAKCLMREGASIVGHNNTNTAQPEGTHLGISTYYPNSNQEESVSINDVSKARRMLEHNLKKVGLESQYSCVLSNIFLTQRPLFRSIIVSGLYARSIADAFSYSLSGMAATRVSVTNPAVDYSIIENAVRNAPTRVILIENILDTCNELAFGALNKDFEDNVLIFNVDHEETYSLISKDTWSYALYLNTDIIGEPPSKKCVFRAARIDDNVELPPVIEHPSNDHVLSAALDVFNIPFAARRKILYAAAFLNDECEDVPVNEYVESILSKFCIIYGNDADEERIDEIKEGLSLKFKELYNF